MIVNSCGPVSVCKVFDTFPPILPPSVMPSWMRTIYCAEMCRCKVTETTMDSYEKHATIKKKNNSLMESNELDQVHADFFLTLKKGGGGLYNYLDKNVSTVSREAKFERRFCC